MPREKNDADDPHPDEGEKKRSRAGQEAAFIIEKLRKENLKRVLHKKTSIRRNKWMNHFS